MVVAKSGFKLKPVTDCDQSTQHNGGRIESLNAKCSSMERLAGLVSRYLGAMVENKTGLAGDYDYELRWSNQPPNGASEAATVPTLGDALEETLGVRLQPQRIQTEVIVVDRLERMPIEN